MLPLAPADYDAILLSAKVAVTATIVSLPVGFAVAYLMTYLKFRGKVFFEVIITLPLTLPPVVVGYFLLLLLGRKGSLGPLLESIGIRLIFTWKAAVIASAVVGFPLLVRSIRIGMESIDRQLIQASRTLGAPWYDTLFTVILPLSFRGCCRLIPHVRPQPGRIQRHDHSRREYPRRHADHASGHLRICQFPDQKPGHVPLCGLGGYFAVVSSFMKSSAES